MPAVTGKQYIDRIDSLKPEIWLHGEKVNGKLSEHPAFKGVMNSQAKLYDIQNKESLADKMTFISPSTGSRVGLSFLQPRTKEDLEKRRLMIQEWAKTHAGMMGRSPDYMNTALMSFASAADIFTDKDRPFKQNLLNFFETARENDLCMTHSFVNPQVNRSALYFEGKDRIVSARAVDSNKDGILIKGARLLATKGGMTDEVLIFPSGGKLADKSFAFAFSIPSNTPGLKFLCRESFAYRESSYDHPLGSRFEEMDTVLVFDDVLVPWERVFLFENLAIAEKIYAESSFFPLVIHQALSRQVVKTEFVLGVAELIAQTINITEYLHVQGKIAEIIAALESLKALLFVSEMDAKEDRWGIMAPSLSPLNAAITAFPRLYPRFMEILQLLGASGMVTIPTEKDFDSPIKEDLGQYLQGADKAARERVKAFRLAWDISMSAFGSRQTLYERFFFGDPLRLASNLYWQYDLDSCVDMVKDFLKD